MIPDREKFIDERVQKAIDLFEGGYNCSQAVVLAYCDHFGLDFETAAKLSSSFGGGMGRLREVCGAVTGMFALAGLQYPAADPSDSLARSTNYGKVQELAAQFKSEMGSYICADLLQIRREPQEPVPSERTKLYYNLRPCTRCVATAARIFGEEISKDSCC
ncbi:MAG: C_GCAxxG_C_C family protein [Bacteroidales bacterium]|nr:C_GCAxxG_C_C family protein [Bacteroidales bacterium]